MDTLSFTWKSTNSWDLKQVLVAEDSLWQAKITINAFQSINDGSTGLIWQNPDHWELQCDINDQQKFVFSQVNKSISNKVHATKGNSLGKI